MLSLRCVPLRTRGCSPWENIRGCAVNVRNVFFLFTNVCFLIYGFGFLSTTLGWGSSTIWEFPHHNCVWWARLMSKYFNTSVNTKWGADSGTLFHLFNIQRISANLKCYQVLSSFRQVTKMFEVYTIVWKTLRVDITWSCPSLILIMSVFVRSSLVSPQGALISSSSSSIKIIS